MSADNSGYVESPFVLDLAANPHPALKEMANAARHQLTTSAWHTAYWRGVIDAMVAATGCPEADLLDWLAR